MRAPLVSVQHGMRTYGANRYYVSWIGNPKFCVDGYGVACGGGGLKSPNVGGIWGQWIDAQLSIVAHELTEVRENVPRAARLRPPAIEPQVTDHGTEHVGTNPTRGCRSGPRIRTGNSGGTVTQIWCVRGRLPCASYDADSLSTRVVGCFIQLRNPRVADGTSSVK